ncbi:integumentary mucin C.1-like [Esox lucius]|uniref:integumentary mucin C.1-like n=1 Tax=Esox lucius TaxID=8010 RepID=UPI0014773AE7|nr:integumentary mucin C.1-like [Esox lucius]
MITASPSTSLGASTVFQGTPTATIFQPLTVAGTTTRTTGQPVTVPTTGPRNTTTTFGSPSTASNAASTLATLTTRTTPTTTTTSAPTTTKTTTATTTTTTSTTATTRTTTTTAPIQPAPVVVFIIQQLYVPQLSNPASTEFQTLALTVIAAFDVIYKTKYGSFFIRTIVLAFTPITRSRSADTQAEVKLVFNQTAAQPVPQLAEIGDTLKAALNSSNSTIGNLTVVSDSIKVTVLTSNTTATPVITSAITSTTPATTTTKTTTTTAVPLSMVPVVFRSLGETFTSDLSNSSTQAFQNRALLIKTQLEPFYRLAFISFNSLTVTKFSSGSIINTMNLAFLSSSVPNNTAIGNVLINAARNITAFNIDPTSVTVNGTANSGVGSKASLFTASCLVVLSMLLSRQQ